MFIIVYEVKFVGFVRNVHVRSAVGNTHDAVHIRVTRTIDTFYAMFG